MSEQGTTPISKREVKRLIQGERRELERVLDQLDEDQWVRPGLEGDRSAKDILAHITTWERRMLGWLDESDRGLVPERPAPGMTWDDLDRLNELTYAEHKDKPLVLILEEAEASHAQVLLAVGRMTDADLFDGAHFVWRRGDPMWHMVAANTWWHYLEHRHQLEAWLSAEGGDG